MFPSLPRGLLVSCEYFFKRLAPSYARTISCKFIILNFGGKFILASKSTVALMVFSCFFSLGEKLCSQTFPLGQLPQFICKHSPHHDWLSPKTISLSLLTSFIPASPGTLIYPNVTVLHVPSWIFPCPSGLLCHFPVQLQGSRCPRLTSPPQTILSLCQEGQEEPALSRDTPGSSLLPQFPAGRFDLPPAESPKAAAFP